MEVVALEVFVGLMLVAGALVLLAWSLAQGDHQHADRLALMPLQGDRPERRDAGVRKGKPGPEAPGNRAGPA